MFVSQEVQDVMDAETAIVMERARLEREVIQAAKADLEAETRKDGDIGIDRLIAARRAYRAAVIALLAFEAKQKK